jgi:hypothetical protein
VRRGRAQVCCDTCMTSAQRIGRGLQTRSILWLSFRTLNEVEARRNLLLSRAPRLCHSERNSSRSLRAAQSKNPEAPRTTHTLRPFSTTNPGAPSSARSLRLSRGPRRAFFAHWGGTWASRDSTTSFPPHRHEQVSTTRASTAQKKNAVRIAAHIGHPALPDMGF